MKAMYIYNPDSVPESEIIERAMAEIPNYIQAISIYEVPEMLRYYVRTTPALIIVNDDLQGEQLISEGTDGKLLTTAVLYKRLDEEEKVIHQQENFRLDNLIKAEKQKTKVETEDAMLFDMLERGLI